MAITKLNASDSTFGLTTQADNYWLYTTADMLVLIRCYILLLATVSYLC